MQAAFLRVYAAHAREGRACKRLREISYTKVTNLGKIDKNDR